MSAAHRKAAKENSKRMGDGIVGSGNGTQRAFYAIELPDGLLEEQKT
jgi:hypothetical protein